MRHLGALLEGWSVCAAAGGVRDGGETCVDAHRWRRSEQHSGPSAVSAVRDAAGMLSAQLRPPPACNGL